MPGPRITEGELQQILNRKGYGIESRIASSLGKGSIGSQISGSGPVNNLESNPSHEQVEAKRIQIGCSGKVVVRVKFYRYRLADYSRAISEKALIDACCYAGILCGDTEKEIRLIDEGQHKVDSREEERTEVVIEYPEVDFDNLFQESTRSDGR